MARANNTYNGATTVLYQTQKVRSLNSSMLLKWAKQKKIRKIGPKMCIFPPSDPLKRSKITVLTRKSLVFLLSAPNSLD